MKKRVGLLLISTGRYHHFIQPLISSADEHFLKDCEVFYFLYTDSKERYNSKREIVYIDKAHLAWPGPTLYRYNTFVSSKEILSDYKLDYLFYSDIDMLFVDEVGSEILSDRVVTVHPGFQGARGTPEYRTQSLACVYPYENMTYFAGGFNGGSFENFMNMSTYIDKNIQTDYQNGIIAIWHDESHLNRYMIDNKPTLVLDPGYCYGESMNIPYKKRLLALDKNHAELRQ